MEVEIPELFLDLGVFGAAGDGFLHPFGFWEGLLLRADLHRVLVAVSEADEIGQGWRFDREAGSEIC